MPRPPWRLGLVGHPVAHSLSPKIHAAALAALGLEGSYSLFDAPTVDDLAARVAELRAGALDGLNVTLPHKQAAAALCDRLEADAATLGVANTLVMRDGALVGANTDVGGLVAAIALRWPGLAVRDALVLGAGGAARAAVLAARRLGAERVSVWNRTRARAAELAVALADPSVEVVDTPEAGARGTGLIIQAGSGEMGLEVGSDAWEDAVARARPVVAATAPDAVVVDLVYKPRRTVWVEAARREGREADDGLAMLVHQARLAFSAWTDREPPIAALWAAVA